MFNKDEHKLLDESLNAARKADKCNSKVNEDEKIFHVIGNIFIGSEFGAISECVFDTLNIRAVVNITAGSRRVPNIFVSRGVEYINFEIFDHPGASINPVFRIFGKIDKWVKEGRRILFHCSAGLSRSASAIIAMIMYRNKLTLLDSVNLLTKQRGRKLQCNPTFWLQLAQLERTIFELETGTKPTYDFTEYWLEDFGRMGFTNDQIIAALKNSDWVSWTSAEKILFGG